MDPARLAEIDTVFEQALEHTEPDRARFLAGRCAEDPELRREVEALLELSGREVDALLDPVRAFATSVPARIAPGLQPGETLGAYRLVRHLGQGGMGLVFLAERIDGSFEKLVALKVLESTVSSPDAIRRFEQERRILAGMEHPNIARLLDAGIDRRGLPYLVLEHIEGLPVDQHCDQHRLPIEARIRLIIETARAVQAAHRNLVVHRDLKPANLLVTASGRVALLDFGIAKLLGPAPGDSGLTKADGTPMTPTYASPEQVRGQPITTASDVYQLGLLLYELLTGHRPQAQAYSSLSELVRLVAESEAIAASRVVASGSDGLSAAELAARRQNTPAKLARQLRPELDAVLARALEKAPEQRYASAEELATELERYLAGHPVLARRATLGYRVGKWAGRNRAAAAAIAFAALATLGYAATVTIQARELAAERDRAQLELAKATEVERFLVDLFQTADPTVAAGSNPTAAELLARGIERVNADLTEQPEVQARMLSLLGQIEGRLGRLAEGAELERRSLALRRERLGPRHPEVAESLHRLGTLEQLQGNHAVAAPLIEEAVAQRREFLPGSRELAESLAQQGLLLYFQGATEEAEPWMRESLAILRTLADPEALAEGLNSLGLVVRALGQNTTAADLYTEALAINRTLHGNLHPDVAVNLYNLARTHQGREDYQSAQPLIEEMLAIDRVVYGDDHHDVAADLALLCNNLQKLGRLEEADVACTDSMAIFQRHLAPGHPRIASTLQVIGQLRTDQGRFAEAEGALGQALELRRTLFGDNHTLVAQILVALGTCYSKQGRLEKAEEVWLQALAMTRDHDPALTSRIDKELAALARQRVRLSGAPIASTGP